MKYSRRRRYGDSHIEARLRQIDELLARVAAYADEIAARRAELAGFAATSLWLNEALTARAQACLEATAGAIAELSSRAGAARQGFVELPRLEADDGRVPEPIAHDDLAA